MATVLLIEPHADSAHAYAESLERAGFRVETATTPDVIGQDLVPNIVVLSVPRVDRSLLRVFAHGRPVPRIFLSSDVRDEGRAAELDCAAVLIRPVLYDILVNEVRRVLKLEAAKLP